MYMMKGNNDYFSCLCVKVKGIIKMYLSNRRLTFNNIGVDEFSHSRELIEFFNGS